MSYSYKEHLKLQTLTDSKMSMSRTINRNKLENRKLGQKIKDAQKEIEKIIEKLPTR